jgi:hypothetical protein
MLCNYNYHYDFKNVCNYPPAHPPTHRPPSRDPTDPAIPPYTHHPPTHPTNQPAQPNHPPTQAMTLRQETCRVAPSVRRTAKARSAYAAALGIERLRPLPFFCTAGASGLAVWLSLKSWMSPFGARRFQEVKESKHDPTPPHSPTHPTILTPTHSPTPPAILTHPTKPHPTHPPTHPTHSPAQCNVKHVYAYDLKWAYGISNKISKIRTVSIYWTNPNSIRI